MDSTQASRTAVFVCQGRAFADGRLAVGRFSDPVAALLLRPDELQPLERARAPAPPRDWRSRMNHEMIRGSGEVMVPRTVTIDDAVREQPAPQVVNLGAGLDSRAWRMPELAASVVFEVDHPASQADKKDRLGALEPTAREVRFVAVDFTNDSLDARLHETGHRPEQETIWIWEGVIPYLTKAEVTATLRVVVYRSAPASRLVVNYQVPSIAAAVGRSFSRTMSFVMRNPDMLQHEPRRSAWRPGEMRQLLSGAGFHPVRDDDLLTVAGDLALEIRNRRSVGLGRVCIADR